MGVVLFFENFAYNIWRIVFGGDCMCGISGFINYEYDYTKEREKYEQVLENMNQDLFHRGPDSNGYLLGTHFGIAHTRLSIRDLENGAQPMTLRVRGNIYHIVYNGEIYNADEIKQDLMKKGWEFVTTSDTEVILVGFAEYGIRIVQKLNGIFAFGIVDKNSREVYLVRDQAGVKPLYYATKGKNTIFSSEIKGIFRFPEIRPEMDVNGWNEIFSIGPAKTYGCGVFKGICEVKPGYYIKISREGVSEKQYWSLRAEEYFDSYEDTVEHVRFLVTDSIKRQMVSDVEIATFLSGGIDSSVVSAICARELGKEGKKLKTFSFDFVDNDKYFQANSFQPSQDRPFVDIMVDTIHSEHRYLLCNNSELEQNLYESVDVRDLPTMADVDSSMLYFCKRVKPFVKVVLTGECADEIFGGYPWFHKKECFEADTFPWSMDMSARKTVLKDEFISELHMDEYAKKAYQNTIRETPTLAGENQTEARRREISYLNIKWFMQTLLDRMDRASMYSGLEARVPFADIRIMQLLYNVPWNMKTRDGVEKMLLRDSMKGLLDERVLYRKKSPYPKTYDPRYEKMLADEILQMAADSSQPLNALLDQEKVKAFVHERKDYGKPWYGQLMAGPQMLAYLLQVNYWMKKYHISI